jgi:hypothetical protein
MAKRKPLASGGGERNGYEVGYGKPPRHSQFQPGQSGNPRGRRKGLRNLKTDVQQALSAPVTVMEGGHRRTRSTQQGLLYVLRELALHGNPRAAAATQVGAAIQQRCRRGGIRPAPYRR